MSHKWNHNFPKIAREAGFVIRELAAGHCIDWRFIASVDPYGIVNDKDYEKLDEFIPHISEVPIGTVLNIRILDPAIGKYFVLAQFSVQYLLFCKQFLDDTVVEIRNTAQDLQRENDRLERSCRKKNEEIVSLHRKLQRAENVQAHQLVYPCSKCTKNFISLELLNAHVSRKHFELSVSTGDGKQSTGRKFSETDSNLIQTIKLELEVKQLKERLNATEKDLMDQRNRDHHCHSCTVGASKAAAAGVQQPTREAIEHQSVGIQSNLVDAKDVDEKEVQTSIESQTRTPPRLSPTPPILSPSPTRQQLPPLPPVDYISKSDLEAIVREQREQFESWKSIERQKFNHEIEHVRKSLTEAIQELEKRDRVTPPAPPQQVITVERKTEQDDNIWKQRYHELEQMYENSQRQVRETVENIESVYGEKFKQFERLMDRKNETAPSIKASAPQITPRLLSKKDKVMVTTPANDIEKHHSAEQLPKASIVVSDESEIDEVIHSTSEGDQQTESDEEIRSLEAAKAKLLARISVISSPVASPPKEVTSAQTEKKPLISPRRQILNTFKSRLKALGIDPKTNTLPKDDLDAATEALAERRDANKKKHKNFFITRKQLVAKVDQIAKGKLGESRKTKPPYQPNVSEQTKPVPKLRSSFQASERKSSIDILPSKLKLVPSQEERQVGPKQPVLNSNVFKAKSVSTAPSSSALPEVMLTSDDIITVQADVHTVTEVKAMSPALSEHQQILERLLDTPVKRVGTPPDVIANIERNTKETNESDLSDILEAVPLQPKPIPKKRVLFNLDREQSGSAERPNIEAVSSSTNKPVGPTLSSTAIEVSKVDEESDWNISSFEEEK